MCGKYLPHPEQQHKVLTQGRRDHCFLVVYCNWPYQINITAEIVTQQFCLFVLCWQEGNPVWFSAGAANLLEATDDLEAVAAAGSAPCWLFWMRWLRELYSSPSVKFLKPFWPTSQKVFPLLHEAVSGPPLHSGPSIVAPPLVVGIDGFVTHCLWYVKIPKCFKEALQQNHTHWFLLIQQLIKRQSSSREEWYYPLLRNTGTDRLSCATNVASLQGNTVVVESRFAAHLCVMQPWPEQQKVWASIL